LDEYLEVGSVYEYSVRYRVDLGRRVIHRTVVAKDADDARERIKAVDPRYIATVRSPRRGKAVIEGMK